MISEETKDKIDETIDYLLWLLRGIRSTDAFNGKEAKTLIYSVIGYLITLKEN